ncbi:MAG: DM13 domain-containing protein [Candidatus Kariarchaeaceae archaeon]|jgi:hypothetical protein
MLNWFKSLNLWIKLSLLIGIIVVSAVGWWLISPLFLEGDTLNEDLPDPNEVTVLYHGTFVKIDNTHQGSGLVEIVKTQDNGTKLLFRDVDIANGPSLVVYLSKKATFGGIRDSAGEYINLGDLPANIGNFSMNIDNNTELSEFMSVLIWCEPFKVVFTYATLTPVI